MVHKGADVCMILDRRVDQWHDEHFDLLAQEADRCDGGLKHCHQANLNEEGVVRIFS